MLGRAWRAGRSRAPLRPDASGAPRSLRTPTHFCSSSHTLQWQNHVLFVPFSQNIIRNTPYRVARYAGIGYSRVAKSEVRLAYRVRCDAGAETYGTDADY